MIIITIIIIIIVIIIIIFAFRLEQICMLFSAFRLAMD